jgi:CheY-like chemotaxis protein
MRSPEDIRKDLVKLADELLEESSVLQESARLVREEGIRIRAAATPGPRRERASESQGSILVVDDDPGSLKLLRVLLQSEGYEVRAASDAELALLAVQESIPRLVVTDLYMPGMSGITLIRRLKADASTRAVPIVVVTMADRDEDTTQQALAARGAACYIKPIRSDTFVPLIKTVIGTDPEPAAPASPGR